MSFELPDPSRDEDQREPREPDPTKGAEEEYEIPKYYCTGCETYTDEPGVCHGLPKRDLKPGLTGGRDRHEGCEKRGGVCDCAGRTCALDTLENEGGLTNGS